jgi:hypothetical protein
MNDAMTFVQAAKLARQPGGEFLSDKEISLCESLSITPMQVPMPASLAFTFLLMFTYFCSIFSAKNSYCVSPFVWVDCLVKVFFVWLKLSFIKIMAVYTILLSVGTCAH